MTDVLIRSYSGAGDIAKHRLYEIITVYALLFLENAHVRRDVPDLMPLRYRLTYLEYHIAQVTHDVTDQLLPASARHPEDDYLVRYKAEARALRFVLDHFDNLSDGWPTLYQAVFGLLVIVAIVLALVALGQAI